MPNYKTTIILTISTGIVLLIGYFLFAVSLLWLLPLLLVFSGALAIGSAQIQRQFYINSHCEAPYNTNKVAITFDDGPNEEFSAQALQLLEKYEVKATFFCIGKNIATNSSMLQKIDEAGHTIGNHSFAHIPKLDWSSQRFVEADFVEANQAIANVIGKIPLLFRPPFGVTNPKIARAIKKLNFESIGWNIRSLDTAIENEEEIFNRIKHIKGGDIVLLHDSSQRSINVLEKLLILLKKQKLEAVTVDKLLNLKAYK